MTDTGKAWHRPSLVGLGGFHQLKRKVFVVWIPMIVIAGMFCGCQKGRSDRHGEIIPLAAGTQRFFFITRLVPYGEHELAFIYAELNGAHADLKLALIDKKIPPRAGPGFSGVTTETRRSSISSTKIPSRPGLHPLLRGRIRLGVCVPSGEKPAGKEILIFGLPAHDESQG
jgi:hypothetical protein